MAKKPYENVEIEICFCEGGENIFNSVMDSIIDFMVEELLSGKYNNHDDNELN